MTPTVPIGNESAPIQLAQCRFPGLAISNAQILIHLSNKIYGSNFVKQHSEAVMVWNYQNADWNFTKKITVSYIIIFGTLSFPVPSRYHGIIPTLPRHLHSHSMPLSKFPLSNINTCLLRTLLNSVDDVTLLKVFTTRLAKQRLPTGFPFPYTRTSPVCSRRRRRRRSSNIAV